jgi:quinol monooxygenase YgiN
MNTLENGSQCFRFKIMKNNIAGVLSHRSKLLLIFFMWMLTFLLHERASAQDKSQVVRLAKLQIDSFQLEHYRAALKEEIETSVRVEPGVLTLYAVYEKDNPTHVTVFEIYADADAFKMHLETPHFKKYKNTTKDMVKSLELFETIPIVLATKKK